VYAECSKKRYLFFRMGLVFRLLSQTRYKLDLVGVEEVRWDKGGTVRAGDCNFFYLLFT
jgi:hypothetical protein